MKVTSIITTFVFLTISIPTCLGDGPITKLIFAILGIPAPLYSHLATFDKTLNVDSVIKVTCVNQ